MGKIHLDDRRNYKWELYNIYENQSQMIYCSTEKKTGEAKRNNEDTSTNLFDISSFPSERTTVLTQKETI